VVHSFVCSVSKIKSENVFVKLIKFSTAIKMQADRTLYDCRDMLNESLQQLEIIESITKDPTSFINKHFNRNKHLIKWRQTRRFDLKTEIGQYCDQFLEENESNKANCL
jgi:hypothetical protein